MATGLISSPSPPTLPPVDLHDLVLGPDLTKRIPGQSEFLEKIAKYDFVLYEGEGGAGKSYILRWWLVLFLLECFLKHGLKGVRVGIFCEDYPSLEDRQLSKMRAEFPRGLGTFKQGKTTDFVLRECYGSGVLAIRNLDKPEKYSSSEFAAIAVDELTKNPLKVFNDLRWRLRWPRIERPKFAGGTNPGGIGHNWVKKYWIEKDFPRELKPKAAQFVTVKARTLDNLHLAPGYHEGLLTLPPDMARRVGAGDWDVPTGQYFPYFRRAVNVIPHAEAMRRIQPWWYRALSGDWGDVHPCCFHWHAKDEEDCVITFDEFWGRSIGEAEAGRQITEIEEHYKHLAPLRGFVFSWDAGKLSPRSSRDQPKSIDAMLNAALGKRIPKTHPADSRPGVRLIRARLMSQLIGWPADPERKIQARAPRWLISDRCTKLIDSIPEMMHDEDHVEEMAKLDHNEAQIGDDPVDSAGVGLQWMLGRTVKPDRVKEEEKLADTRRQFAARAATRPLPPPIEAPPGADPKEEFFKRFGGSAAKKKPIDPRRR